MSRADIRAIVNEVIRDVDLEEADFIKAKLYNHAWGHIKRDIVRGLPEWYKTLLATQMEERLAA